jgi:CDP-2,3-bis-(O-geranylgeranyl)-sn-glycerol synthase
MGEMAAVPDLIRALCGVLYFFVPAYAANMAPVLVRDHFEALAVPMDGGLTIGGIRVLGDHKTWRGLLAGVVAGIMVYAAQRALYEAGVFHHLAAIDYATTSVASGALMGLGAGLGDAVKSFLKRRVGIEPGASWIGFDQLDFMVGSYLLVAPLYAAPLLPTLLALPIVFIGSIGITTGAYWLHLKEAWI